MQYQTDQNSLKNAVVIDNWKPQILKRLWPNKKESGCLGMFMLVIRIAKVELPKLWSLMELNWYLIPTAAIWTFPFHKISGWFWRPISNNSKGQGYQFFWSENSDLLCTLIFLLFFAEFVKTSAFYKLLLLYQRVDMFELQFDAKITITFINSHPQLRSHYLWYGTVAVSRHTGLKKCTYLLVHSTTLKVS